MENTDYGQTGDIALDNLLQETQQQIQETYDFILPDTMVHDAIEHACTFFNLPEVPVVDSTGVCVWPNTPGTPFDDVFGFDRAQMMEMGIQGEDSLTLVYTHECAHRALQDWEGIDGKAEELACDYFAGIHAALGDMDVSSFSEALAQTPESDTHPAGELRAEAIAYGQEIAQGTDPKDLTFEYCMDRFEDFLAKHPETGNDAASGPAQAFAGAVSFGSAYTKDEYLAKANNCFHEAEIYQDKANRSDDKYEIKHNLDQAQKWRDRGENYLQQAKYADDKNK